MFFPTASAQSSLAAPTPANRLIAKWEGPYGGVPPFDRVEISQFKSALEAGMVEWLNEIERIAANSAPPTLENTIIALERSGRTMDRVLPVYEVWASTMNGPEFQVLQREMRPKLSAFNDKLTQNEALFERISAVYETKDKSAWSNEQKRLVWLYHKIFVRAGASLNGESKARLSQINQLLENCYLTFNVNLLAEEEEFLILKSEDDLAGLAPSTRDAAAASAYRRKLAGSWVIQNTRSWVENFLIYSDRRDLREKVWRMFVNRNDNGNERDNNSTITEILRLRAERAKLLGFSTHAHWRLESAMAKTPERAMEMMAAAWEPALARVYEDVAGMQALADKERANIKIEPWDYRYYAEKVRKALYDFDQDEVKSYLQLEKLRDGVFWVSGELFNFAFKQINNVPVYHPDVRVWEVTDKTTKRHIGLWYFDPYERSGKRSGSWVRVYRNQHRVDEVVTTIVSNNANFIKGKAGEPVLISWDEAQRIFHDFGHALRVLNSNVAYQSLSESTGAPDYTNFPSQLLEHWLSTPDVLQRFAVHYQTGKPISQSLVDKIERASTFNEGITTTEYLASALMDMKAHLAKGKIDPKTFERETLARLAMPHELGMRYRLAQFGHVFSSDAYSAGYYSYLWTDAITADALAAFTEEGGPYDHRVAERLRKYILSVGNAVDPAEAYRSFRGRDPKIEALIKELGFPATGVSRPRSQQAVDLNRLPFIEDSKIKEFDTLPKAIQETRLAANGPLIPEKYTKNNFSTRVFLKGNSPFIIDYAIQPGCTALIEFSVDGVKPVTYELTSPGTYLDDETNRKLTELLKAEETSERAAKVRSLLFEDFLRHPEKGRASQIIHLPASFGDRPQVGKLSIQAFTIVSGELRPAFFSLYGLGVGKKAVVRKGTNHAEGRKSNHSRNDFALGGNSITIDKITLSREMIDAGSGPPVTYGIHSLSAFYNVKAFFNREEDVSNNSITNTVFSKRLGSITENGWIRPMKCSCQWNGMGEGRASRGWHDLEVRAWQSDHDGDWAIARSAKKVLVR